MTNNILFDWSLLLNTITDAPPPRIGGVHRPAMILTSTTPAAATSKEMLDLACLATGTVHFKRPRVSQEDVRCHLLTTPGWQLVVTSESIEWGRE